MRQVLIQTQGFELTQALREACHKCAGKLVNREEVEEKVEFFLEYEGRKGGKFFRAKVRVRKKGGTIFVAETGEDMYQAIREVCKKARLELDDDGK